MIDALAYVMQFTQGAVTLMLWMGVWRSIRTIGAIEYK